MITEVILPQLGQTMREGTITEWWVVEGSQVSKDDPLFSFESDKAALEVVAPASGILRSILMPGGATCPVLTVVALITDTVNEDISSYLPQIEQVTTGPSQKMTSDPEGHPSQESATGSAEIAQSKDGIFASPRARALARKQGVDLALLTGSGTGGRIIERDVTAYLVARHKATPAPEELGIKHKATPTAQHLAAQKGIDLATIRGTGLGGRVMKRDVETFFQAPPEAVDSPQDVQVARAVPLSGLRKTIADRMSASLHTAARVTLTTEANATEFVALRQKLVNQVTARWGFKPRYDDLFVLTVAKALGEFPYMNARLRGEMIEELASINIGVAVDTDKGLKVVVVRNADRKGLHEIGRELRRLIDRACRGESLPEELSGGTFTITNLGMFGVDAFTPIMNPPETAILGIGRILDRAVVTDKKVTVCPMLTLSLSFDHRLVDGAAAARFLQTSASLIEEPALLLI